MYYFLRENVFEDLGITAVTGFTAELDRHMWYAGSRFPAPVPPQVLTLDPDYGPNMADLFDDIVPLMSGRLLQVLRDAGVDNIDAYPMVLERAVPAEKRHDYSAINVIGNVAAVDMTKSVYTRTRVGAAEFGSIIIDPAATGGLLCFRLAEGPIAMVIHKKIADIVQEHDFRGILLQRTEDYDGA